MSKSVINKNVLQSLNGSGMDIKGVNCGSVGASAHYDFAIATNCAGLAIIFENGVAHMATVEFTNVSGTLTVVELDDTGGHISVSGTNLRITNHHGGAASYFVLFLGRGISGIAGGLA